MAETRLRDEHGNPIQLTDEHGNPVRLTDEHGNPMHLTGVAFTTTESAAASGAAPGTLEATSGAAPGTLGAALAGGEAWTGEGAQHQPRREHEIQRSSSSSSSSDNEEHEGGQEGTVQGESKVEGVEGRRKKKGLKEKIKEKLTGGKHKDTKDKDPHYDATTTTTTAAGGATLPFHGVI